MNIGYGLYYSSTAKVNNSNFYNNSAYEESFLYHYQLYCKLSRINIIKNLQFGSWGLISGTTSSSVDLTDCYIRENTCNYLFYTVESNCYIKVHDSNTQNNTMKKSEKNSANVNIDNPSNISLVNFDKQLISCNFNSYQYKCNTVQYSRSIIMSFLFATFLV